MCKYISFKLITKQILNFEHILEDVRLNLAGDLTASSISIKSEINVSQILFPNGDSEVSFIIGIHNDENGHTSFNSLRKTTLSATEVV
jgi:hypothetical protein